VVEDLIARPSLSAKFRRGALGALPIVLVLWALFDLACGEQRWELAVPLVVAPALAYGGREMQRLFAGLAPIFLLGLVYDAMRFVKNAGLRPERVHVCDLRALDARLASVDAGGARVPLHDWLQAHATPSLDVFFAIPYGTFLFVSFAFAIFLYVKDDAILRRWGWTFLAVNVVGFATYHVYPAAPPWYFHAHGCSVDLSAGASEGANLARVDRMMGVPYFSSFYGRSSDVFGAVPSLHVAYPLLTVLYGWRYFGWTLRALSTSFFVSMCAAAVYLDHHWVIDVILGILYTLAVYGAVAFARARSTSRRIEAVS
jgi:hypothetical protein